MNDSQPAFIRHVKYAGSFVVVGDDLLSREHFVRQQLSTMRDMMSAEPVLLALSVSSITVYYEDSHSAFLCHSLRRVSCITCDSNHCQFAYVASDDRNSQTQCCHTFLTIHPWQADELNSTVAGVFHEAYVNRQLKKQRRAAAEVAGHGQTEDTGELSQPKVQQLQPAAEVDLENRQCIVNTAGQQVIVKLRQAKSAEQRFSDQCKSDAAVRHSVAEFPSRDRFAGSSSFSPAAQVKNTRKDTVALSEKIVKRFSAFLLGGDKSSSSSSPKEVADAKTSNSRAAARAEAAAERSAQRSSLHLPLSLSLPQRNFGSPVVSLKECIDQHFDRMQHSQSASTVNRPVSASKSRESASRLSGSPGHGAFNGFANGHSLTEPNNNNLSASRSNDNGCVNTPTGPAERSIRGMPPKPPAITRMQANTPPERAVDTGADDCQSNKVTNGTPKFGRGDQKVGSDSTTGTDRQRSLKPSSASKHGRRPLSGCYQNSDTNASLGRPLSNTIEVDDDDALFLELAQVPWYQPTMSREASLEMLAVSEVGSFVVRDSTTHPRCYALSVKVPRTDKPAGVCHYLIQPATDGKGYKMKGLDKQWPSVNALIAHHSIMCEMLPCTLRLAQPPSSTNHWHLDEVLTSYSVTSPQQA